MERESLKDSRRTLLVIMRMSSKRAANSRSSFQTRMGRPTDRDRYESMASMEKRACCCRSSRAEGGQEDGLDWRKRDILPWYSCSSCLASSSAPTLLAEPALVGELLPLLPFEEDAVITFIVIFFFSCSLALGCWRERTGGSASDCLTD